MKIHDIAIPAHLIVDAGNGQLQATNLTMIAFKCGRCEDTHIAFSGMNVNLRLPAESVTRLVDQLITPLTREEAEEASNLSEAMRNVEPANQRAT